MIYFIYLFYNLCILKNTFLKYFSKNSQGQLFFYFLKYKKVVNIKSFLCNNIVFKTTIIFNFLWNVCFLIYLEFYFLNDFG